MSVPQPEKQDRMRPLVEAESSNTHHVRTDTLFFASLCTLGGVYIFLIIAILLGNISYTSIDHFKEALASREIQYAIKLSLVSCSLTTLLSLWVSVPIGYLMSRHRFPGKNVVDALLDIPIVLPPLVIGLSLLILFRTAPGLAFENWVRHWTGLSITFSIPAVILAQFMVACAFAVRTMRATFDQISPRQEEVALTLGCTRNQAFWMVVLPDARQGLVVAATLAWARSLGEFGPILVFAGATRMHTEVLPTTVFLELSIGNIESAVAVSLLMVLAAMLVLVIVRVFGRDDFFARGNL